MRFGIIDYHFFDVILDMVANDPNHQVGISIQQQRCFGFFGLCRQRLPQIRQVLEVSRQLFFTMTFGNSADNDAHPLGTDFFRQLAQAGTFFRRLDPAGNPHIIDTGHHDHIATGNGKMSRGARSFGPHGILDDLHHDLGANRQVVFFHQPLKGFVRENISRIQECVFADSNVNKRSLHPGQDIFHPALVNVPYHMVALCTFYRHFQQYTVISQRHTDFFGNHIDDDFFRHGISPYIFLDFKRRFLSGFGIRP